MRYAVCTIGFFVVTTGVVFFFDWLDFRARLAVLTGGVLATSNTLTAYLLVLVSLRRSTRFFMRAILGGMLGRMALLIGATIIAIVWCHLPHTPLVLSLMLYFALFLGFELAVVHKRLGGGAYV